MAYSGHMAQRTERTERTARTSTRHPIQTELEESQKSAAADVETAACQDFAPVKGIRYRPPTTVGTEKPTLVVEQIMVSAMIPVRGDSPFQEVVHRDAIFVVNMKTWECEGHVEGYPVLADQDWWLDQCKRVSDRVRASISSSSCLEMRWEK